LTLTIIS